MFHIESILRLCVNFPFGIAEQGTLRPMAKSAEFQRCAFGLWERRQNAPALCRIRRVRLTRNPHNFGTASALSALVDRSPFTADPAPSARHRVPAKDCKTPMVDGMQTSQAEWKV